MSWLFWRTVMVSKNLQLLSCENLPTYTAYTVHIVGFTIITGRHLIIFAVRRAFVPCLGQRFPQIDNLKMHACQNVHVSKTKLPGEQVHGQKYKKS